ncbi:hypothetical protein BHM03_00061527 [Ensete ventricosum]|nr:hypothetical protein BHM03_00061527 [Ensete ventricosum]
MTLYDTSDAIMCRPFPTTLRGIAPRWYNQLLPSSIHSFNQLAREFEGNFLSSARPKPTATSLGMRQKEEEHLEQYLARFTDGRANQYVTVETLVAEKGEDHKRPQGEPSRGPPSGLSRRRVERGEQTVPQPPNVPLNYTRMEIFLQIREKGLLKTPNPLRSQAEDQDHRRYCRFHRDYGHDTEQCYDLKN